MLPSLLILWYPPGSSGCKPPLWTLHWTLGCYPTKKKLSVGEAPIKPTNTLVDNCFPYLCTFIGPNFLPIFLQNGLPRWNTDITSVEVHPQLSYSGRPVDVVLVGAGSLSPRPTGQCFFSCFNSWNSQTISRQWSSTRRKPTPNKNKKKHTHTPSSSILYEDCANEKIANILLWREFLVGESPPTIPLFRSLPMFFTSNTEI